MHFFNGDIVFDSNATGDSDIMLTFNTFHIHPMINDSLRQELLHKSLHGSLNIKILIFIDVVLFTIFIIIFNLLIYGLSYIISKCKIKSYPRITNSILYLSTAAGICSGIIDQIFWGGSLDFMCISWGYAKKVGDRYSVVPKHLIFDIKDIYLTIGLVLLILLLILYIFNYLKLSKDNKKELDRKSKDFIKNILRFKKNNKRAL